MRRRSRVPIRSHNLLRALQGHLSQPGGSISISSQPSLTSPYNRANKQESHQSTTIPTPSSEPLAPPQQASRLIIPSPTAPVNSVLNLPIDSESLQSSSFYSDVFSQNSTGALSLYNPSLSTFDSWPLFTQQDLTPATSQPIPEMSSAAWNGLEFSMDTQLPPLPIPDTIDVRYSSDSPQSPARRVTFRVDPQTHCCVLHARLVNDMGLEVMEVPPGQGRFDIAQGFLTANFWVPSVVLDITLGVERRTLELSAYVSPLPLDVEVLVNKDLLLHLGNTN